MKTILVLLVLASFCIAKDSVAVNVAATNGIMQTKIISYDADKLMQSWQCIPTIGIIPTIPPEMMQYVVRDTSQKNMPPFISTLVITRKDLGKDTASLDIVHNRVKAIVKTRILVK
jgi:hypothetical protein